MSNPAHPLSNLNPPQLEGVQKTHGPLLVIAGAGSGKTKMLTSRIVHLMSDHQVSGHNILAVTFTNKAASEMRERVSRALGLHPDSNWASTYYSAGWMDGLSSSALLSQPVIGTFHSICTRILRREIEHTPFKQQFVIYDDSDQLSLVKDCFTQLNLSDKSFSPKSFQYAINEAKCSALEPGEIKVSDFNLYAKNLARVYELYQKELFKNNAIDFGEIITMTYRLLRDNPEVLAKYQNLYQFIHVDEYQDTNRAQYLLVKLLAAKHRNICVVGDEDQSIYKWRGADIRNILDFEKDYPEAHVVKLEQNYRSTQTIIEASSKVISHNTSRKAKTLWTENDKGEPIFRFQVSDDRAEAELVVSQIKRECAESGFGYNDVAIFYRTNAQSRVLEDIFRRERIPYKMVGGLRFYDRKEIKDVLAYFRVLMNTADSVSLKRIINVPQRSIGKSTVEKLDELSIAHHTSIDRAIMTEGVLEGLGSGPRRKVKEFADLLKGLQDELHKHSLSEFYHLLLDRIRYVEELKNEGTEEALSRVENLQEFDTILVEFENFQREAGANGTFGENGDLPSAAELLPLFLENVTLVGEQEQASIDSAVGTVSMMTLHTSKGLEFPLVFMVGVEEGLFPSIRGQEENDDDIEEERRLCYVGMTRAKRKLYMTHAVCRRVYGNIVYHEPARFFDEMPADLVQFKDLSRFNARPQFQPQTNRGGFEDDVPSYDVRSSSSFSGKSFGASSAQTAGPVQIGLRVKHGTYGVGIVRGVEGITQDAKVTVEFPGRVVKKFIFKFANLEVLS